MRTLTIAAAMASILAVLAPSPAEAETRTAEECVVHVVGQSRDGELQLSQPRCYADRSQAMAAEGVDYWGPGASARAAAAQAATFTIGYHCDGYNLGGPCLTVVGDSCIGGWLNMPSGWNNRVSSTQNGCPTIRHFDGYNLSGTPRNTYGVGPHNLTTFNNRTSSIQYP